MRLSQQTTVLRQKHTPWTSYLGEGRGRTPHPKSSKTEHGSNPSPLAEHARYCPRTSTLIDLSLRGLV